MLYSCVMVYADCCSGHLLQQPANECRRKALTVSPCCECSQNKRCNDLPRIIVPANEEHKPAVTLVLPMNEDCKATGRMTRGAAARMAATLVGANATLILNDTCTLDPTVLCFDQMYR